MGLFLLALVAMVALLSPRMPRTYEAGAWSVWLARGSTLVRFSSEGTYLGRVAQAERAWQAIRASPLLGYGWGRTFLEYQTETTANVLLLHGFVGTSLILAMYVFVGWRGLQLWRRLPPSRERGYMAGILALLVLYLAMTFSQDTLCNGGFAVAAAAFVDRIGCFHKEGLLDEVS